VKMQLDIGDRVRCDDCNKDFSDSEEVGGVLFGSKGYCPDCAPKLLELARKYNEENYIRARAHPGESFRDFILRIRGGNNLVTVTGSKEDCDEWIALVAHNMGVTKPS